MQQEAADKLVGGERHGLVSIFLLGAIILPLEGDPVLIEGDQAAVGNGNPVSVAGQISQDGGGSSEQRTSILPIITEKKLLSATRIIL